MKRLTLTLAAVLALLVVSPVWAEKDKAPKAEKTATDKAQTAAKKEMKKEKDTSGLKGYYAIMAGVTGMDESQKAQLKAKVDARDAELKAWDATNGEKVKQLSAATKAAQEAKDKAKVKQLSEEKKALVTERATLEKKHDAAIESLLTPEQKQKLAAHNVYTGTMSHYGKIKLTDEQKEKVRAMAAEVTPTLPAEGKPRKEALNAFWAKVDNEVLTAEQRDALKASKEPKEKKPKAE